MSQEQKYIKDKNLSDAVAKTKVSHGKIESVIRVRNASSKEELDLELKRLEILKEIDKSTVGKTLIIPKKLRNWQQLILIIGNFNLKTTTEIVLAAKKLEYSGVLSRRNIKNYLFTIKKEYFSYDKDRGWQLTNKGQNEFSRLKQFI